MGDILWGVLSTLWENFFLIEVEMVRGKPALLLYIAILKPITFQHVLPRLHFDFIELAKSFFDFVGVVKSSGKKHFYLRALCTDYQFSFRRFENLFTSFLNLQIIGIPNQAEKDEIVKSVMDLKRAEIEEGYTMDAVMSRQVRT